MIIETIQHGAIPYKCKHCKTVYLWTPSCDDGMCRIRPGSPKCQKSDCYYYEPDPEVVERCPACKSRYEQKRISAFRYKIVRGLKGAKQK